MIMQNYYYQVLIDGKVFPYEGCKIWNKESAEVYLKQAETIVKTHVDYKYKNCKVELVRMESGVIKEELVVGKQEESEGEEE